VPHDRVGVGKFVEFPGCTPVDVLEIDAIGEWERSNDVQASRAAGTSLFQTCPVNHTQGFGIRDSTQVFCLTFHRRCYRGCFSVAARQFVDVESTFGKRYLAAIGRRRNAIDHRNGQDFVLDREGALNAFYFRQVAKWCHRAAGKCHFRTHVVT